MGNILSRIQEIAQKEGITIGAMERAIGASKGVLSRAINNGTDIQSKWIQIIVENYPDYSTRWLLTGQGNMYAINTSDSFRTDSSYSAKFNRIFEESIGPTEIPFEEFGLYCGIKKERMKAIYFRDSEFTLGEIGRICTALGLNPVWVESGQGEQFVSDQFSIEAFKRKYKEYKEKTYSEVATRTEVPGEGIPLIPTSAMAGFFSGEQQVLEYECERFVVPTFKGAEFLISVKGSSMYPKYNSGDIVACKRIPMKDLFFQWNKVYVLDTDQGPLIKRVKRGRDEDHITIVSDNEKYEPFELNLQHIYNVALVIGVIRLE